MTEEYKKVYLTCNVSEGQFSNESAVSMEDYQGGKYSGFFNNNSIKDGKLEVKIWNEKENLVLVGLPGRLLEVPGAGDYITVKREQIDIEN